MSYATAAELRDYAADLEAVELPEDDDAVERLLDRAARDLDAHVLRWPPPLEDGLRVDLDTLTGFERGALRRATLAQAAFRVMRDESDVVLGPDGIASVGGLSFSRDPQPHISPDALVALSGCGGHLVRRSGTLQAPEVAP